MENPCYLDSDQSMYESALGRHCAAVMSNSRRPQHLATLHHPHSRSSIVSQSSGFYGTATMNGANTIAHVASHGIPATAHIHGGRVVGVTGIPHSIIGTQGGNSLSNAFPVTSPQPLYSCQAPRGHGHVYQCPGHRGESIEHFHHSTELRDQPIEYTIGLREGNPLKYEHQCENHLDTKQHCLPRRDQPVVEIRDRPLGTGPDQRTEYHYGGSDYSSTEPIYAQPHLQPLDDQASPNRTPPMTYTTVRGSLRTPSATLHHGGTPAQFLVRTDSTGASTSSSTLPTVSALMAMDVSHPRSRSHGFRKVVSLTSATGTSTKLKGNGVLDSWKAKYLEGSGGSKKTVLLMSLLVLLLILVLGGLAAVLYLTLGGGFGAIVGQKPQLVHLNEEGNTVVTGQFRITNQNYWSGLDDVRSESFRILSRSIEKEMDSLFLNSVWSREFNRSEVASLSEGSLVVNARFYLNSPDAAAAKKLGSAFLRGLETRRDQDWLGPYAVDVSSIRFAEVLVEAPAPGVDPTESFPGIPSRMTTEVPPAVGWGEWGPWSSCDPCSPQYDQIRTRTCRLDAGKGLLVSNVELCSTKSAHLQGGNGNMESRPCRCPEVNTEFTSSDDDLHQIPEREKEMKTTVSSYFAEEPSPTTSKSEDTESHRDNHFIANLCNSCSRGEVCVALEGEMTPSCRPALNTNDPTGCGGLCARDEVCQVVGSRAFECHSSSRCLDNEWQCADGLCIPQTKRCDGHHNCYDRSDEVMCNCGPLEFHCGSRTSCLPLSAKCDGNVDCWDGFDEANCSSAVHHSSNNDDRVFRHYGSKFDSSQQIEIPKKSSISDEKSGLSDIPLFIPPGPGLKHNSGAPVVNRTATGLSSLSNRERELLS